MNKYQVSLSADFVTEASTTDVVRKRLKKIIAQEGFDESNFVIDISNLAKEAKFRKKEEAALPIITPALETPPEVKKAKAIKVKASKPKAKKHSKRTRKSTRDLTKSPRSVKLKKSSRKVNIKRKGKKK
jgi:hypothetical protein